MPVIVKHWSTESSSVSRSVSCLSLIESRVPWGLFSQLVCLVSSCPHQGLQISEVPSSCQYHEQHWQIRFDFQLDPRVAGETLFSLLQSSFTIGRRRSPSRVWLELPWEGAYSWLSSWSGSWSGSPGRGRRTRRWWRRRRSSRAAGGGGTSCHSVTTSSVLRPRQEIRKKYLPSMWENRFYLTLNFEQRV